MDLESTAILAAAVLIESKDKEGKEFQYYSVCLQTEEGLSLFTINDKTALKPLVGKVVLAKFRKQSFDGKEKIKLTSLELVA